MVMQSIKMAWKAVGANKMRSFLTMLGIIIGVIALVVLVSLVTSATGAVTDQVTSLGMNYLTVSVSDDKGKPLRLSNMSEITENEDILAAAPYVQLSSTAKSGRESGRGTVYGVTSDYFSVQGMAIEYGRLIKSTDVENNTYVAVITQDTATELFDTLDVIGETISLDGRKFTVIGVLEENDSSLTAMFGSSITVYIPYTTAVRMSDSLSNTVTSFYVSAADENNMDAAEDSLTNMMLERFNNDEDAFSVMNLSVIADAMSSITDMLSLLLGGIATISLLVGGIGIMNIMLVSVTERTREIGVRKAIGAGRGSILLQFLIEALVLSLMGCAIGILLSWGILEIVTMIAGDLMTFKLSANVVTIAVVFSVLIGVLFGIYPANQAAKKNPIQALRYDG